MYVKSLRLQNVKSFTDSEVIIFSKGINILVGPNNSGKSVIIKALYHLQDRNQLKPSDLRTGTDQGEIIIELDDLDTGYSLPHGRESFPPQGNYVPKVYIRRAKSEGNNPWRVEMPQTTGSWSAFNQIPTSEPNNFIYPYLSKRKVVEFTQNINRNLAVQVPENLANLVAKIDRISDPNYELYEEYKELCQKILGFQVSSFPSDSGKQAGIRIGRFEDIPLEAMGEGISSLLGLITNLCVAQHKLFLIEELENDIHPKALKSLLDLIVEKSEINQFVISTHSNIVTKMLGSATQSKLHKVEMSFDGKLPTSVYSEIDTNPQERRKVLEELGYEMFDFDLWEGWLFLEESSAEAIVREYLIPWFTPNLQNKLRTLSCNGVDGVEPRFTDFDRLFLFTHLEPVYKNKAWVLVDGDQRGKEVIDSLKQNYTKSGWLEDQFISLSHEDFERYYPKFFQEKVRQILEIDDKQKKRAEKQKLLSEVLNWITSNSKAKKEFEESANEIIKVLQDIEKKLIHTK